MAEIKIGDFSLLPTWEGERDFAQTRYRWRVKSISAAISYRGTHVKRAGAASGSRIRGPFELVQHPGSSNLSLSLFLFYLPFFFDPFESPRLGKKTKKKQSASSFHAGREFVHENWNRSGDDSIGKFVSCVFDRLGRGGEGERKREKERGCSFAHRVVRRFCLISVVRYTNSSWNFCRTRFKIRFIQREYAN